MAAMGIRKANFLLAITATLKSANAPIAVKLKGCGINLVITVTMMSEPITKYFLLVMVFLLWLCKIINPICFSIQLKIKFTTLPVESEGSVYAPSACAESMDLLIFFIRKVFSSDRQSYIFGRFD